jgi:outer membrane protein insertion porin family
MLNKKNFITIYLLSFLFLFNFNSYAKIVENVIINGNSRVSDQTILLYGKIDIKQNLDEEKINVILNNLNATDFFEDIKIEIKNSVLVINLKEYPVVNQIILKGEPSKKIAKEIKKNLKLKERNSFIKSYLSSDIEIIKEIYSSLGYNFASIETKINKVDNNNFDLLIEIIRGKKTKISSINFIGDKKLKDRKLRDIIASEEDKFWKVISRNTNFNQSLIDLDIRLLTNYYKSIGYYDVVINSKTAEINNENNINLTYSIEAGTRFTVDKITTNVDPVFDNKLFFPLKKSYDKVIGEYYSPFAIKKILEDIDKIIENNSLQFVEHNVEEDVKDKTISIQFNIYEGERQLVERINIKGNNITDESVIRGELILDEGDPFTNLGLDKSIAKLKSRRIFKDVTSVVTPGSESNLKVIDINVSEMPTGEISAGAGIGTNGGSFELRISENNWLGEGKKLDFILATDSESLTGKINYTDPNYNFMGNSINYFIANSSNDKPDQGYENTIYSTGVNTSFEQYRNIFTNLGLSASYDDLRTVSSASESLKKQSGEFSELAGNYGFMYDNRNRAFMPTSGSIISFNQNLPIIADRQAIENTFNATKYKSFSDDVVGASKFYISTINGIGNDDVRLSRRKNLSSRKLRGFERGKVGPIDGNDHIGGNYTAALNFEASLPNLLPETTKTDINLFLDFANVWGVDYDSSIDDSNKIRSSTGIAANWLSPVGPLSFTFATNLTKANTDTTEFFNFNLGTTF